MSGLPILTYHAIDDSRSVISTSPSHFRATLSLLKKEGFECVDLMRWINAGRPDVPRAFALAFDDGLRSIRKAAEAIAEFGFSATAFLVAGRMGRDNAWPGQPSGVPRMATLSWSELGDLRSSGFRFGAHTLSHPRLPSCDAIAIEREITESRFRIEDATGSSCPLFAYPYGEHNAVARDCARPQFAASFGTHLAYATKSDSLDNLSRVDAYYLNRPNAIAALVDGSLPRILGVRRVARAAKQMFKVGTHRSIRGRVSLPARKAFFFRRAGTPAPRDHCVRDAPFANVVSEKKQYACPECRAALSDTIACVNCGHTFARIANILDLRLAPDRYLSLEAEREKASALAEVAETTDLTGLAKAYYAMTDDVDATRRKQYLAHIARAETRGEILANLLPDEGPILEVGCGTGGLLVAVRRRGLEIEGTDIALRWLVLARKRIEDAGLSIILTAANAEALPWADATFSCVVADSVLEHLDDPRAAMAEWLRVTRVGGRLIVWSPNRFSLLPDPHVRLWGLGWLPRRWQTRYVRARRGIAWPIRPLGAFEARMLVISAGWSVTQVVAGCLPAAANDPRWMRAACHVHNAIRHLPLVSAILRAISPIWELHAERREGA